MFTVIYVHSSAINITILFNKCKHVIWWQLIQHVSYSASTERFSGHQTNFSDLEKGLSDPKSSLPAPQSKAQWPDCHPMARLAGFAGHSAQGRGWSSRTIHHFLVSEASSYGPPNNLKTDSNLPRDLPTTRRDRTGRDISCSIPGWF